MKRGKMSNDLKWMLGSDFHFPFHEPRYVDLWFKVMKWYKPDVIDYLGDISDQDCYARFTDGRSNEFLNTIKDATVTGVLPIVVEQEKITREFYAKTRKMNPDAELFSALGNHDIRVFDYADKKLPDLLEHITPEALWDFKNLGYDYIYYSDLPKKRFGDIHVHHGVAISKHAGESVRSDIENFGVSIVRGHSHRHGSYFRTYELRDEILRGYEIGHMSDVRSDGMSYTNVHNWQPGFATAHIVNGYPHITPIHITSDFTCMVDGKLFSA
jgi:hypothetical protein